MSTSTGHGTILMPSLAGGPRHDAVTTGLAGPNAMFAYAEVAFKHASEGRRSLLYLASAMYAFAYLFPDEKGKAPSPFDPRYRWAGELYISPSRRPSRRRVAGGSS
jgi:hypothetical protein